MRPIIDQCRSRMTREAQHRTGRGGPSGITSEITQGHPNHHTAQQKLGPCTTKAMHDKQQYPTDDATHRGHTREGLLPNGVIS